MSFLALMLSDSRIAVEAVRQIFPSAPKYTESDIGDQTDRVAIVTGANTGVGKEVAQVLYSKNATVWVCARNEEKSMGAIEEIRKRHPTSKGSLHFMKLDLADLTTVSASADQFLAKETRLDLLFNNAGVMAPPQGSKTTQGYEMQLGTNCVGPFLFTKKLTPLLQATARTAPKDSVRVVWVSSSAAYGSSPKGGFEADNLDYHVPRNTWVQYGVSKAGNYYHSTEFARRHKSDGIVSVALNPGNLRSDLDRHIKSLILNAARRVSTYPPIYGAYTELFAATSPEVTIDRIGDWTSWWIAPWGRLTLQRPDLVQGSIPKSEGGTGMAETFWAWCEEQVKPYL